jgi:hypothetical protein
MGNRSLSSLKGIVEHQVISAGKLSASADTLPLLPEISRLKPLPGIAEVSLLFSS